MNQNKAKSALLIAGPTASGKSALALKLAREHGGVIIQYRPDVPQDQIDKLKATGAKYNWEKLILAPYPPLKNRIALTAWTRLDAFDDLDEARIRTFIDAWRKHGPEDVPNNMDSVTLP